MALKWTIDKIKEFIENENYEFIKYISGIGKDTRMIVWCKNENHQPYEVIFNNFRRGTRCLNCYNERRTKWTDKKIIEYINNNDYIFVKMINSKGVKSDIKIKCPICNNEYTVKFETFKNGHRCLECFLRENRTSEEEIEEMVKNNNDEFIKIVEYHSLESIIEIRCSRCKRIYKTRFDTYLNNGTCNKCKEPRGEKRIRLYLESKSYNFKSQYRIDKCRYKLPLPFDFRVEIDSDYVLIEYDGYEHYHPIEGFGGVEKFKDRQRNDKIKDDFCKDNGIKLIRIPYWEYENIEQILDKELN